MTNSLMVLPKCPTCGAQMVYRPSRAKAEAYCGVWYDCHNGKCACATLLPSIDLQVFWAMLKGGKNND